MSSIVSELAEAEAPAMPARPQTAGQWLRAARQQRGLHIAALAAALKVPQAKLEALETDRHADLPDATFARALAKAVCRTLKIDAAPVMALLPRGDEHELHVSLGLNAPYRERGSGSEGVSLSVLQRPIVWGPAFLLLAAAGLYVMPAHWLERPAAPAEAPVVAASVPASALPEPTAASVPNIAASEATVAASIPVASPAAVPSPVASAPVVSKPTPVVASADGQLALTVKTTAPSWVEVIDGSGQTLVSKIIPAGEDTEIAGAPPLKVKIGNVAGTQLMLRGKPVDLNAQSKDNVARLELN